MLNYLITENVSNTERRCLGTERWEEYLNLRGRKKHDVGYNLIRRRELHNLLAYTSSDNVRMTSEKVIWMGYIACAGETRITCKMSKYRKGIKYFDDF